MEIPSTNSSEVTKNKNKNKKRFDFSSFFFDYIISIVAFDVCYDRIFFSLSLSLSLSLAIAGGLWEFFLLCVVLYSASASYIRKVPFMYDTVPIALGGASLPFLSTCTVLFGEDGFVVGVYVMCLEAYMKKRRGVL